MHSESIKAEQKTLLVSWSVWAAVVELASHWGHHLCSERLDCTESTETPSAFHVTVGPRFSIFNSDISSESVISQSGAGDLKRREGKGRQQGRGNEYRVILTSFKCFCKTNWSDLHVIV